ncbi:hypothetical protein ABWJ92_37665 [Streptomyces sp. NPDC000609]|uniref:hypothetical protein n=1 Tax=Streptomyces sp. NPDC000609 TaxID=3160957 RepID=UPI003393CCEA
MDPRDLLESSRRWMGMALSALSRPEDADIAVHHAAVACEHLLKSYLAGLHPVLLAEGKDFTSLLHAVGYGDKAKGKDLTSFRSVALPEAYARVAQLIPTLTFDHNEVQVAANARNGVAHCGIHDPSRAREITTICIRLAEAILPHLTDDAHTYWYPHDAVRKRFIEAHATKLSDGLTRRIVHFRDAYRRGKLPEDIESYLGIGPSAESVRVPEEAGVIRVIPTVNLFMMVRDTSQKDLNRLDAQTCPACEESAVIGWRVGSSYGDDETPYEYRTALCCRCLLPLSVEEILFLGLGKAIGLPPYGN